MFYKPFVDSEYARIYKVLEEKYPEKFTKETIAKRNWKKDQLIKQQQEEWEGLCKEPGDRDPDPETERRIKELLDNMD